MIEPVGVAPVQCIRVSADSGLYVTDDFIPTHNSGDGPHFRRGGTAGTPGMVDIPHVGKKWRDQRWRHPGLPAQRFMQKSIARATRESKEDIRKTIIAILSGKDFS